MKLDLRSLPKLRDGLSWHYCEHCRVEQESKSVAIYSLEGELQLPAASLGCIILGPGSSITHAAVKTLAESGCSIVWSGENFVRFYACGLGETRKGGHLEKQARLWADEEKHQQVVMRMYRMRFRRKLPADLTIQQIRGMEGARVRDAYARASDEFGVEWKGRSYDRGNWNNSDPVNRALSAANSCLYGVCHAAIVSGGYTPGLGFIHTGKALSFVYDIADLYKLEITVPAAFSMAAENPAGLESKVRHRCRDLFHESKILSRVLSDIDKLFSLDLGEDELGWDIDEDPARPAPYWDPPGEKLPGKED